MKDKVFYDSVFNKDPREEMMAKLDKKINGILKRNPKLKKEAEVKELIYLIKNLSNCFDQVTIYAFATSELRDFHRKKAGIL